MRQVAMAALILAGMAGPAGADETTGKIAAYDRLAHVIVLEDKTVWPFPGDLQLPADLQAGDRVKIEFTSGPDGALGKVTGIARVEG